MLRAVDFFCGAGGMSYGLTQAGIQVLGGVDNDPDCRETYERNVLNAQYIERDISKLTAPELGRRLLIESEDPELVFAGCSPCQFWSKIRTDKTKAEKTAFLLKRFQKFIRFYRPGFIVVENVPGLHSNKQESILPRFIEFLDRLNYSWADDVINANHYGVPQNRMRYLLIASLHSKSVSLPLPEPNENLVVSSFIGVAHGFQNIAAGHLDRTTFQHTTSALQPQNLERIRVTPGSGGDRSSWKDNVSLQIDAYKGRDQIFRDVYGRMFWNKPAPTITTRFNSFSNGRFGHPEENRAISIREGATLQTFPREFYFHGSSWTTIARQIGNAVPPELGRRIGTHLVSLAENG